MYPLRAFEFSLAVLGLVTSAPVAIAAPELPSDPSYVPQSKIIDTCLGLIAASKAGGQSIVNGAIESTVGSVHCVAQRISLPAPAIVVSVASLRGGSTYAIASFGDNGDQWIVARWAQNATREVRYESKDGRKFFDDGAKTSPDLESAFTGDAAVQAKLVRDFQSAATPYLSKLTN